MVYVRLPCLGVLALCVVYVETGTGLSGVNVEILARIAIHMAGHKVPWAAVGDYNVTADEIMTAHWVQRMRVKLLATQESTCHSSGVGSRGWIICWPPRTFTWLCMQPASTRR